MDRIALNEIFAALLAAAREKITRKKKRETIDGADALRNFLREEIARAAGELAMKYSQKRLGRAHFSLCKDGGYAQELIDCQTRLHAELLADAAHLLAKRLGVCEQCEIWRETITSAHSEYVATVPPPFSARAHFCEEHFFRNGGIKELSDKTGMFLFRAMPLTEELLPGNVQIFRGQARAFYINMLRRFDSAADAAQLASRFQKKAEENNAQQSPDKNENPNS